MTAPGVVHPPRPFYNGSPGRELTPCSDCGFPADALFGDHGGPDLCMPRPAAPTETAADIIRRIAKEQPRLSINDCRAAFDRAGIKESRRGPAFAAATRRKWIEYSESQQSTGGSAKGHRVHVYTSLIYRSTT